MANNIFRVIIFISLILSTSIFFLYRGYGWPLGKEGLEAIAAFSIYLLTSLAFCFYQKRFKPNKNQTNSLKAGLIIGILWTMEICMNNLLAPGLPQRDIYDNIFWAVIALIILIYSIKQSYKSRKIKDGVISGFWAGLGSGSVASLTALIFIVFGMHFLLKDPLNIIEWNNVRSSSGIPNIAVYFAYQTLAGAVLHLTVLGIGMGLLMGAIGGIIGRILKLFIKK